MENPYQAPQTTQAPAHHITDQNPTTPKEMLFSFKGRVSRSSYWMYGVLAVIIMAIPIIIAMIVFLETQPIIFGVIALLCYIPILWVSLAVAVKRWHDRDKSGWWVLIGFIPYIGGIWAFIENGCLAGTPGPNKYGPDPLGK